MSSFSIGGEDDEANGIPLGDRPSFEEVADEASRAARLRNDLIYATENGCPTGFINPKYEIAKNTALSIGLIWSAVDMHMYPDHGRLIIDQVLSGMIEVVPKKERKYCKEERRST